LLTEKMFPIMPNDWLTHRLPLLVCWTTFFQESNDVSPAWEIRCITNQKKIRIFEDFLAFCCLFFYSNNKKKRRFTKHSHARWTRCHDLRVIVLPLL
jgi:hypothetical protein